VGRAEVLDILRTAAGGPHDLQAVTPDAVFTVRTYCTEPLYSPDLVHTFARRNKEPAGQRVAPPSRPPIVSQVRTSPLGLSAGVVANDLCGRDYFRARVTIEKEATCTVYSNVGI
jgi:hypothetical protein